MCGEQTWTFTCRQAAMGSPPRVRGTGLRRGIGRISNRITPACAGNSLLPPSPMIMPEDHPRVCGEQ